MVQTITKKPISPVDFQFDTAGGGSVTNFTRTKSDGTTESVASFSAAQVPVLDAPIVTSARTPFELITATDRDVEQLLQTMRINMRDMKNFEHYGGVAGSGVSDAVGERNVEVWRKIMDDINSEGRNNGIFFPGARYEFKDNAGLGGSYASHTLPFETSAAVSVGSVAILGTKATTLAAHTNAGSGDLFRSVDVGGIAFLDVNIEQRAASGQPCYDCVANLSAVTTLIFDNVGWANGQNNIFMNGGTLGIDNVWITRNIFNSANAQGLVGIDTGRIHVMNNIFPGTTGISLSAAQAVAFEGSRLLYNKLTSGALQSFVVARTGTYSAALHRDLLIEGNAIEKGDLTAAGINEVTVARNRLQGGSITLTFTSTMSGVIGMSDVIDNHCDAGTTGNSYGIFVGTDGVNAERVRVVGGSVRGFDIGGVVLNGTTGILSLARVQGVAALDCSQLADNSGSGIMLLSDATGGIQYSVISDNVIRSTNASRRHSYGVEEQSATTANAGNRIHGNLVKGYVTADVLAHTGGTPPSAEVDAGSFDLGAAV